jgi:hypothetical protein
VISVRASKTALGGLMQIKPTENPFTLFKPNVRAEKDQEVN